MNEHGLIGKNTNDVTFFADLGPEYRPRGRVPRGVEHGREEEEGGGEVEAERGRAKQTKVLHGTQ